MGPKGVHIRSLTEQVPNVGFEALLVILLRFWRPLFWAFMDLKQVLQKHLYLITYVSVLL